MQQLVLTSADQAELWVIQRHLKILASFLVVLKKLDFEVISHEHTVHNRVNYMMLTDESFEQSTDS
jgi:hypothetical protein